MTTNWNPAGAGNKPVTREQIPGEPTDQDVVMAMNTFGGGFVRQLGQLALAADEVRLAKLKACFSDEWQHYTSHARCLIKGFPL